MEANKVSENCKAVVLPNGVELTYCEFGEEHSEVVISGAFYFHTFTPVLEELAKRYHVYGVVMRFAGKATELNEDGSTHWGRQWGEDIYQFAKALGIEKFHYVGKCHGTNPGWFMVKNHAEMILSFCSFYLVPHLLPQNSNLWVEIPAKQGLIAHVKATMRKEESFPIKMAELQTIGKSGTDTDVDKISARYASCPEQYWDSKEECEEFIRNMDIPLCLCFGTDDILFQDYYDSNIKVMLEAKRARTVIIQGERHLMEIDCPARVAREMAFFIEESKMEDTK